jgi:hypothetical protein
MKTGRLLKFQRPGGDVHVYIYRDGDVVRAAVYVMSSERVGNSEPAETLDGVSEAAVETAVRALVEARFPRVG